MAIAPWILVPCLTRLFREFDALAPQRDHASDGAYGNEAHAASTSDHNPDETGNTPYEDADSTNEVHAIDVDKDLRHEASMEDCVQLIVARHRAGKDDRLQNVIFNRRIWSRSWGWTAHAYTGPNPHDHHAHFSARYTTAQESDTRPWGLLEEFDMALDADDKRWIQEQLAPLKSTDVAVNPIAKLQIPDFAQPEANRRKLSLATWIGYTDSNRNADKAALLKAIAALPQVDTDELVAALAPILVEAVIAGLPEDRDDITPAELQDAIVGALKVLVERPPATA